MRKNPLTMLGRIDRCWLFAYQTPVEDVRALLPSELEPVTHRGCAFWNVVFCKVRAMRPRPMPAWCGIPYWHVAYRLYVRFRPAEGDVLEGLYFARSDCSSRLISAAGSVLTDYNFHTAAIRMTEREQTCELVVGSPHAPARATVHKTEPPQLPAHSAFESLDQAAAFLKYKPAGMSVSGPGRVNMVRIVREEAAWK